MNGKLFTILCWASRGSMFGNKMIYFLISWCGYRRFEMFRIELRLSVISKELRSNGITTKVNDCDYASAHSWEAVALLVGINKQQILYLNQLSQASWMTLDYIWISYSVGERNDKIKKNMFFSLFIYTFRFLLFKSIHSFEFQLYCPSHCTNICCNWY